MLWIGGINLVWASIFFGVFVFALRTDTEGAHSSHHGPGPDPGPDLPRPPDPRGPERRVGRTERRRLRGAERAAARRYKSSRSGSTYYPRPVIR
jgi:hypothetical protein